MEIIIGKQWQEKTQHYIKQSLRENAIWLVDAAAKEQYERMLLEESENKAILLQKVMTFEEFFNEQLHLQQCFNRQVISPLQSMLIIYDLLKDFKGEIIQSQQPGTLKQIQHVFTRFNEYNSQLDDLQTVAIPIFSKKKLSLCWQLYKVYQARIKDLGMVMKGDYQHYPLNLDEQVHYYIDGIEHFNEQTWALMKQMKYCTILLTCDKKEDAYTHFSKKKLESLEVRVCLYETTVSEFKQQLIESYQNLKINSVESSYSFIGLKAADQNSEIDAITREIYQLIARKEATYQDFILYCTNESYLSKIAKAFELHQLPYFINQSIPVVQAKILVFIKGLLMYAKTKEDMYLILLFRSRLYKGIFQDSWIDYCEKQLKTTKQCLNEEYLKAKQHLDMWVETFNNILQVNQKAKLIQSFLVEMEVEKSAVDEKQRAYLTQTMDYLKQFNLAIEMESVAFIDLFLEHFTLEELRVDRTQDMILIVSNTVIFPKAKYVYILGCNEDSFPKIGSDNELILNDEVMACEKAGIHLGLNLFEQIEREYLQWFKLLYLEKHVTMSYMTGSLGGDEYLPSSLYLNLMHQWHGKEKIVNKSNFISNATTLQASLDIAMDYGIELKELTRIRSLVKEYQERKNQPQPVDVALFNQLISKKGKLAISPSELETYNGCPFKYYVRYGLNLFGWLDRTLKANDFGTIVHDVLDILSDLYCFDKTIKDYLAEFQIHNIQEEFKQKIYPTIYSGIDLNEADQGLFLVIHHIATGKIDIAELTQSQQYLFSKLQHDLFNTVKILIYQATLSDFKITEHEAWASKENGEFIVQGRIDRVEQFQQYIKVVDYKSSQKALDLCLATLGFNIQMLLYLDMICQNKAYEKGAVLYFNTKQRVVKMDQYLYEDQLDFAEVLKLYKMEGYINEEETLIQALDRQYDPSVIANVKFVKTKGHYSGNLLDKTMFESLLEKVNQHVENILVRIYHEADIRILPSHHDSPNINMLVNPCTYCDYSSVCLKDVFYNENNEIAYIDEKTMLKVLGGVEND